MGKSSLSEKAYDVTKEKIVFGKINSGQVITVGDLASEFNMSKTPVRDALNRLKSDGLLNLIPYKGYVVNHIDVKELDDLFTLRILLEGGAAELATRNANKQAIKQLTELANYELEYNEQTEINFMKTNFNFHIKIAEASGNKMLKKLVANILDQMQRVLYFDLKTVNTESMKKEHIELVTVIDSGNAMKAKEIAIEHIESSRARIFSNSFGNRGGGFVDFRSY